MKLRSKLAIVISSLAAAMAPLALAAVAVADDVYALDYLGNVTEYNAAGGLIATYTSSGNPDLEFADYFALSGNKLFVTQDNNNANGVGEYQLNGGAHPSVTAVNTSLIPPSLSFQFYDGIALLNGNILVANVFNNTVGEYTQTGMAVNASFLPGLNGPHTVAVSGGDIFVWSVGSQSISEYTTSGTLVNASLITGLQAESSIGVSGGNLFVTNGANGTVSEYTTSGALVNASLITGLSFPTLAIANGNLLITSNEKIVEYDTSGNLLNSSVGSASSPYVGLFVVATPEPSTQTLLGLAFLLLGGMRVLRRRHAA